MTKQLKKVICFFAPAEIYGQLHQAASDREVPLSQLLRGIVRQFLASEDSRTSEHVTRSTNTETNGSSTFQKLEDKTNPNRKE